jgi:hypothetical protein
MLETKKKRLAISQKEEYASRYYFQLMAVLFDSYCFMSKSDHDAVC